MGQWQQEQFDMVVPTRIIPAKKKTFRRKKAPPRPSVALAKELLAFNEFGKETVTFDIQVGGRSVPAFVNEFWTAGQRQANSLHEVSYRACFKPQLPRFFIERLTKPEEIVYDPFMGRGTTPVEALLLGRVPMGCDINPLSVILTSGRLNVPSLQAIDERLRTLDLDQPALMPEEPLHFYHPLVLTRLCNLRQYFAERRRTGSLDRVDEWIQMVATNRLTGHSPGFFSVRTMPPNQAVSVKSQIKINAKHAQTPPDKDFAAIILKKSRSLLKGIDEDILAKMKALSGKALLLTASCDDTPGIPDDSVSLVVTSPPFLNIVAYELDNWLRCWFNSIDPKNVAIWQIQKPAQWQARMTTVFQELRRILRPEGHVAFEVGEIDSGRLKLEELVIPAAVQTGLEVELVLINDQNFTKTSNCWGISNQTKGTNTNRVVLLRRPDASTP